MCLSVSCSYSLPPCTFTVLWEGLNKITDGMKAWHKVRATLFHPPSSSLASPPTPLLDTKSIIWSLPCFLLQELLGLREGSLQVRKPRSPPESAPSWTSAPCFPSHTSLPGPRSSANPHRPCSFCSLRAAPRVQWDRRGPGCTGRRVAMAGEHPASWSARVREVAHRPPVGADSSALLPQVSAHRGPRRGVQGSQGPRRTGRGLAEALGSRRAGGGRGPGAGSSLPLLSYRRALPVEYRVRLGALHLGPTSPCTLSVPLRQVLLLPDYSEDGARGDLALLQLCRPVPLSARVQPVCLTVPGDRPPPGTPC